LSPLSWKKTIDHPFAPIRRKIDGKAFLAEGILQVFHQGLELHPLGVDLVDDDETAEATVPGRRHHALGHRLDADRRIDDHRRCLHGCQNTDGPAHEIDIAWGVQDVDMSALGVEIDDGDVQGMLQGLLLGIEITHCIASGHASHGRDLSRCIQQALDQGRFSGTGLTDECDVADILGRVAQLTSSSCNRAGMK